MNNFFARNIGIYYKDFNWAKKVMKDLKDNLPTNLIVRTQISRNQIYIFLKDGTVVEACPAINGIGYRWDICYMQEGIDKKYYKEVIMPCLVFDTFDAIVIKDARDIMYKKGQKARSYYNEKKEG